MHARCNIGRIGASFLVYLAAFCLVSSPATAADTGGWFSGGKQKVPELQVVLFGAHGNLAKKYLWQSLFEIFDELQPAEFHVFAAATSDTAKGDKKIDDIIQHNVTAGAGTSETDSARVKAMFRSRISYFNTASDDGMAALGKALKDSTKKSNTTIISRILYMAVAPTMIPGLLGRLNKVALLDFVTEDQGGFPTRIVLEKPVGSNAVSAQALLASVGQYVDPMHTLIMDHYLGKTGIQMAVRTRKLMRSGEDAKEWVKFTNGMAFGQAVMVEPDTLEGRTGYFNDYGIVRDVMQNHMTLMLLSTMVADQNDWTPGGRTRLLANLRPFDFAREPHDLSKGQQQQGGEANDPARRNMGPPTLSRLPWEQTLHRFGVYEGYEEHVAAEFNNTKREPIPRTSSGALDIAAFYNAHRRAPSPTELYGDEFIAPTAAQLLMSAKGVPFQMLAGKGLGTRAAYVRQIWPMAAPSPCGPVTITYHLQGDIRMPPGINLSLAENLTMPHNSPALIFTGLCLPVAMDPTPLFSAKLGWPYPLKRLDFPQIGVMIVIPDVPEWRSTIVHGRPSAVVVDKDDEWYSASEEDAGAGAAVQVTPRVITYRLKRAAEASSTTGAGAYKSLLSSALAGIADNFIAPEEVMRLWELWGPLADYGDLAVNTQLVWAFNQQPIGGAIQPPIQSGEDNMEAPESTAVFYEPGDHSWIDLEPLPTVKDAICGGSLDKDLVVVRNGDTEARALTMLASNMIQLLWTGMQRWPFQHVAIDMGPEMPALFDRMGEPDYTSLGPWGGLQMWLATERSTTPETQNCHVCMMVTVVMSRTKLAEQQLHTPRHPNVSHINGLAKEMLNQLSFDLVLLRISNAMVNRYLRGEPVWKLSAKHEDATFGTEEDTYVSDGTGFADALQQAVGYVPPSAAPQRPPQHQPSEGPPAEGEQQGDAPPVAVGLNISMPTWRLPNMSNVPPPPPPYKGLLNIRLSKGSLSRARHVWLVVFESIWKRLEEAGSRAPEVSLTAQGSAAQPGPVNATDFLRQLLLGVDRGVTVYVLPDPEGGEAEVDMLTQAMPGGPGGLHQRAAHARPPHELDPRHPGSRPAGVPAHHHHHHHHHHHGSPSGGEGHPPPPPPQVPPHIRPPPGHGPPPGQIPRAH